MRRFVTCRGFVVALSLLVFACMKRERPQMDNSAQSASPAPVASPSYDVRVRTPQPLRARTPVRLLLSIVSSNGVAPSLESTYNASLHVIIVSRDLRWYEHIHSDTQPASDIPFNVTFPADGEYVLFAYFRPAFAEVQSDRVPLRVGRSRTVQQQPLHTTALVREIRGYRVEMTANPQPLRANVWESFTFRMGRSGTPVANLGSEGALGHLAIVSEDARDFVFAHSTVEEAGGIRSGMHVPAHPALPDEPLHAMQPVGPEVTFHARFPHPGRYKLWAEFTPGGARVMEDFIVEVKE